MASTSTGASGSASATLVLRLATPTTTSAKSPTSSSPQSASTRRILVNAETLRARRIVVGQAVVVRAVGGGSGTVRDGGELGTGTESRTERPLYAGMAWPSFTLDASVVQVEREENEGDHHIARDGASVLLEGVSRPVQAVKLGLRLLGGDEGRVSGVERALLMALAREALVDASYALLGDRFSLQLQGTRYRVEISSAHDQADARTQPTDVLQLTRTTAITLESAREEASSNARQDALAKAQDESRSAYEDVGGLDRQIEQVRELVELPLRRPELFSQYGLRPPRGVLLFGPPGTGKTTLARLAAASVQAHVLVINGPELSSSFHGETEQRLRAVFAEAKRKSPAVVVIDEIDALAPRRDEGTGESGGGGQGGAGEVERRTVATLLTLLDGMEQPAPATKSRRTGEAAEAPRVVVIAATNRPNAIDPALRRPGRLDREIEIGIPNADNRAAILRVMLRKVPHSVTEAQIDEMASQTHGYVGADLSALVREAGMLVVRRVSARSNSSSAADVSDAMDQLSLNTTSDSGKNNNNEADGPLDKLRYADLLAAKPTIRPSAMREIVLDPPKVHWRDIVSTGDTQSRVREAVEWPLTHARVFKRLGVRPLRGVLLYGPPGCSKTMIAQALATESGLNFLAVKGPELYSKYVGESERAVRELFRKARAAAPSVIFLDEIDALTSTRGDDGGAVGDRIIASLLTELDGVEAVSDIVVVAATNRPQVIDPALLRPGRLDRLLYVCPPDLGARRRLFELQTSKMAVSPAGLDLDVLAAQTEGCSGAEIASICQEAGMLAMAEDIDAEEVKQAHFEQAAKSVRRRITPVLLASYEAWRTQQNV